MLIDISHRSYNASYKATLGLNVGTDSDNFLVAATHNLHADETGMWVDNYSKISWASMGVDISNIVGKTINFNDTESGVSIKIKCDDSTSDIRSLIYSINNGSLDIVKDLPRKVYSAGFAYTEGKVKVNISNYFSFDDALLDNLGFSESGKLSANVEYKIEGTSLSDIKCVAEGNGQSYVVSTKSASAIAYLMNSIRNG